MEQPLLEREARALGIRLSSGQVGQYGLLAAELLAWNRRLNLTAITDEREIQVKHIMDSLTVVPVLRARLGWGGRLVDVGSGAGFPGLAIKVAAPDLDVTLIEATGKKVAFLERVIELLELEGVRAVHGRAEPLGHQPEHRERADGAVARAVGSVATLAELLLPLVRVGGWAVMMKKRSGIEGEIAQAEASLELLAGVVEEVVSADVAGLLEDRALVVVRKEGATPDRFPRRPGVAQRRPLRRH